MALVLLRHIFSCWLAKLFIWFYESRNVFWIMIDGWTNLKQKSWIWTSKASVFLSFDHFGHSSAIWNSRSPKVWCANRVLWTFEWKIVNLDVQSHNTLHFANLDIRVEILQKFSLRILWQKTNIFASVTDKMDNWMSSKWNVLFCFKSAEVFCYCL